MGRHRHHVRLVLLAIVLIAVGAVAGRGDRTVAQEATPGPEAAGPVLPLTPDPSLCTVTPRPRAEIETIYEDVNATASPAAGEEEPFVEPAGSPADAAIVADVTHVVVEVIRCNANGGNGLVDATFLTEEHLRDNLAGLSREDFDLYYSENPIPLEPEQWLMVYAVRDVRVLADGRVGANPEIIVPGIGHFRDFLIFEQVDGRWLIDESHEGKDVYPHE
jgi:hypothetical protein